MPYFTFLQYRLRQVLSVVLSFLLIILPFRNPVLAQDKESVAVLDLEGRGVSAIEAATLTDRMRSELVKTGSVTMVERGQMQQILSEQDFQLTGCTSDECAVEIGQLLGVTLMIAGSIGKIGNTYTVDVRTINIGTGQIQSTMTRDYRGEIDGLLQEIEHISWELVGLVHPDDLVQQLRDEPSGVSPGAVAQAQAAPRKKGGSRWLLWVALLAVAGGGGGYYAYSQGLIGDGGEQPIGSPPGFPDVQ